MKMMLQRYYDANKRRDAESATEWFDRVTLRQWIAEKLSRDLRKTRDQDLCIFCGEFLEEGERRFTHSSCVDLRIEYIKNYIDRGTESYLYALIKDGLIVYIGMTVNPKERFRAHIVEKDFDKMAIGFSGPKWMVEIKEKRAIHKYYPVLNKRLHDENDKAFNEKELETKTIKYTEVWGKK